MGYEFEQDLKELINNYSIVDVPYDINDDTNLINVLGYNSITLVQLIVAIENKFGIEFGDHYLNPNLIYIYKNLRDCISKLLINKNQI